MSEEATERILGEIHQIFAERQARFGRKPFGGNPLSLKRRAVAAVIKGIAPGRVAEAAGVSEPSIRNWCKNLKVKIEPPTELKLAETAPVLAAHQTAMVHFQSGLRIEIPVSALTPELVRTFQGVQP